MKSPARIATLYAVFAAIATAANIGAQEIALRVLSLHYELYLAMLAGTAVGLFVKYALDKRYIFEFETIGPRHEGEVFVKYTIVGGLITIVFWGFELAFDWYFGTTFMRNIGAVTGLAIGYLTKYRLDKRYVFVVPDDPAVDP